MAEGAAADIAVVRAWESTEVALDDDEAADLASRRTLQVTPLGSGRWRVTADSRVGVIVGDGWEIWIRPRLRVPRLMFLLAYAVDQRGWKKRRWTS